MRAVVLFITLVALLVVAAPVAAQPHDVGVDGVAGARCVKEVAKAGLLGSELNPSTHRFVGGTSGDDTPGTIFAGTVYCGFEGDDVVNENYGYFFAGPGDDQVANSNFGVFYGGDGADGTNGNFATFNGEAGDDFVVFVNSPDATFNGGDGNDRADNANSGTFYGGEGDDRVNGNLGTFNGEGGNDQVVFINSASGTFNGGEGDDSVGQNDGTFDGGPGIDSVLANFGICINVEIGC